MFGCLGSRLRDPGIRCGVGNLESNTNRPQPPKIGTLILARGLNPRPARRMDAPGAPATPENERPARAWPHRFFLEESWPLSRLRDALPPVEPDAELLTTSRGTSRLSGCRRCARAPFSNDNEKLSENSFGVSEVALADVPASLRCPAGPTPGAAGSAGNGAVPRVPFVTA
jgi:hypothetical protein